jgi:pimeloyl-ACP methyl ester carboxylesterase
MTTTELTTRRVKLGATVVTYLDSGGDGPPVLLLHGCPFSKFLWRNVIPRLSDRFRCVAPDLRALGDTESPAGADWNLLAQLDATQLDPANHVHTCNLADALRRITVPTLIIWGERDVHFPPRWARQLAAATGLAARRVRWRGWLRHHLTAMGIAYIGLLTAFYVDNGPRLLLWNLLPRITFWFLPAAIGLPLIGRALYRYRTDRLTAVRRKMGRERPHFEP